MTYIRIDVARSDQKIITLPEEEKLREIFIEIGSKIPNWKFLDRTEPGIASQDEKYQLRCYPTTNFEWYHKALDDFGRTKYYLKLADFQTVEKIPDEELMAIAKLVKRAFRYHLGVELDVYIITEITVDDDD